MRSNWIKKSPWYKARKETIKVKYQSGGPLKPILNEEQEKKYYILDKDVNYFVNKLNLWEIKTFLSCGGHGRPNEFYIVFRASLAKAFKISQFGYFRVEFADLLWSKKNDFCLKLNYKNENHKKKLLAWASENWEKEESNYWSNHERY